jgi:hypothetical protein
MAIYAHERLPAVIRGHPSLGLVPPLRLAHPFVHDLERGPEGWVETGLGMQFGLGTAGFLPPTTLLQGSLDVELAGIRVRLQEAPSESDDAIVLWFPKQRVLHADDVIQGETRPNLPLRRHRRELRPGAPLRGGGAAGGCSPQRGARHPDRRADAARPADQPPPLGARRRGWHGQAGARQRRGRRPVLAPVRSPGNRASLGLAA